MQAGVSRREAPAFCIPSHSRPKETMISQPEPRSERGATAVEYALMVALIAAVLITAMTLLGSQIIPLYKLTF